MPNPQPNPAVTAAELPAHQRRELRAKTQADLEALHRQIDELRERAQPLVGLLDELRRLDDHDLISGREPAEVFTYGGMIAHVLTFAAHRRTLVVLALDSHGISELGWGDPMVWVATPAGA